MGRNSGNYEKLPEKDTHNSVKFLNVVKMIFRSGLKKAPLKMAPTHTKKVLRDPPLSGYLTDRKGRFCNGRILLILIDMKVQSK